MEGLYFNGGAAMTYYCGLDIEFEIKDDWQTIVRALRREYGDSKKSFVVGDMEGTPLNYDTRESQLNNRLAILALAQDGREEVLAKGFVIFDLSPVTGVPTDDGEAILATSLSRQSKTDQAPQVDKIITYWVRKKRSHCKVGIYALLYTQEVITYLGNVLEKLIKDYPEVGSTLSWTPHLEEEAYIAPWLRESYYQFLAWLKRQGGQSLSWGAVYSPYQTNLEAVKVGDAQHDLNVPNTSPEPTSQPDNQVTTDQQAETFQLQGKHPYEAIFYLDNTTAHHVAIWMITHWNRDNENTLGEWNWNTSYHHARKYRASAMRQSTDNLGRVLLTVRMTEWETTHPDPQAFFMGPLSIPDEQGNILQDNPRALEILVIPAGVDFVEVKAMCNALLLLDDFMSLLRETKFVYGDRLRQIRPGFGIMDTSISRIHPTIDEYFKRQHEEYVSCIERISPAFAVYAPEDEAPRADGPAPSTGQASEPASETTRDDAPDPDSIPHWGRRRDLSTHEVREIVRRCKVYRQVPGGSIAKFHDQESRNWPDPEDAPKGYSLKTLQKWMNEDRFQ